MKLLNRYILLLLLLLAGAAPISCVNEFYPEEALLPENPDNEELPFGDGPALTFSASVDLLGDDGEENAMREIETYIDPEKFRILFFTDDSYAAAPNTFLFESKTRFIKKLPTTTGSGSDWRVSVPLFNYGNAVNNGWYWYEIRNYLRDNKFKIAVLANRPENEWSMRIVGKGTSGDDPTDIIVAGAWYDNSGPHWTAEDSLFGRDPDAPNPDNAVKRTSKTLLDLHHSQYDPIYHGKNYDNSYNNGNKGPTGHVNMHVYDFITEDVEGDEFRPYMGATSSWVSWTGFDGELAKNPAIRGGKSWDLTASTWSALRTQIGLKSPYDRDYSETHDGLTIRNLGAGGTTIVSNGFCNNDINETNIKGRKTLNFVFDLPVGKWRITANMAKQASGDANSTVYLELWDDVADDYYKSPSKGGVYDTEDYTQIISKTGPTSTTKTDITFDVEVTKDSKAVLYALRKVVFYKISFAVIPDPANDNNKDPYDWDARRSIHPSREYPIPMYGIQRFEKIGDAWDWGTNFTLNRDSDDPVFLLRSVVRLDLYIPASQTVTYLMLFYPNVFARCDPMDVWTPTDELWEKYVKTKSNGEDGIEMSRIKQYGPIVRKADYDDGFTSANAATNSTRSVKRYQDRMSWLYGVWVEKGGWNWNTTNPNWSAWNTNVQPVDGKEYHPHIFNPCVQRNGSIFCEVRSGYPDCIEVNDAPGWHHYVVYTGERNINDPGYFAYMGDVGGGRATIAHWIIGIMENGEEVSYGIPLINYKNVNAANTPIVRTTGYGTTITPTKSHKPSNLMATHNTRLPAVTWAGKSNTANRVYEQLVQEQNTTVEQPWPLIRNHRYIFRITGSGTTNYPVNVTSEVRHSKFVRPEVAPKLEK